MANLKEIRTRIASVSSTRKITSAMKMVSAAKLKKAQDAVANVKPYAHKVHEILTNVSSENNENNQYSEERELRQVLVVVITSNRGLCGAFNSNAIKEALLMAENKYSSELASEKIRFMAIGKKGYDVLRKRKVPIVKFDTNIVDNPLYENVSEIAQALIDEFITGVYDSIDIVYNEFVNAATQKVMTKQFLPLLPIKKSKADRRKQENMSDYYIFEPSREYIHNEMIPLSLRMMFYEALLDSIASEHGARMTSMHQATDNASSLMQELTLQYNKARQSAITNEILEIVGGAEALKG